MGRKPDWWGWDLELTPHVLERMPDRSFNETDLRRMLEDASRAQPLGRLGRWKVEARHGGREWRIIVQPDPERRVVEVVTAYALSTR